jgi:hypothetical protein
MVAAVARIESGLLERFRAGEIDLEGYIDLKVLEATAHLDRLTASELARLRAILRARIADEPELKDLVRRATKR